MRKLRTYHRQQAVFEVVMDRDDELRAMRLCHRTLMQLGVEARRRAVRYLVDRHVTSTEPAAMPEGLRRHVEQEITTPGQVAVSAATALEMARAHVTGEKTLADTMGEGILAERA